MLRVFPKKLVILIALILMAVIPTVEGTAVPDGIDLSGRTGDYVEDEVLVRFSPGASPARIESLLRESNAQVSSGIEKLNIHVLKIPPGDVETVIRRLRRLPEVLLAEPNFYIYAIDTFPNDFDPLTQYGLDRIHAPGGWDLSTGAAWVTIAVIDSGVDLSHPDLTNKVLPGYDFVNNDTIPQDDNGHGTHVAGIAAAATNNGIGMAGVSWGANIMPLKVLDGGGNGTYANLSAAIIWATDHGAQVINMSLGGPYPSTTLESAVTYAYTHGMAQVAAAGNSGTGSVLYPAKYAPVIAVAATDNLNSHAGFSNYGPEVDLAAPGVSIYSLYPGGGYGYRSGTSMAAPFVSGLAAILVGIPGNYDAGLVEYQMESSALDLGAGGWDIYYGAGLIQMDRAIQLAMPSTPTPSNTPTATATSTRTPAPTFTSTFTSTSTATHTATPTPARHPRTRTPLSPAWNWIFHSLPSPTFTPTWTPSITQTPLSQADPVSPADNRPSATPTITPTLVTELDENGISTSWTICLGTALILIGFFLGWLARRMKRSNKWRGIGFSKM